MNKSKLISSSLEDQWRFVYFATHTVKLTLSFCYRLRNKNGPVESLIEWITTAVSTMRNSTFRRAWGGGGGGGERGGGVEGKKGGGGGERGRVHAEKYLNSYKPHLHNNGSDRFAFNLSRNDLQQNSVSINACDLHFIKLRTTLLIAESWYVTSPQWYAWWRSSDVTGSTYATGRRSKQLAICFLKQDFSFSYS